MCVTPPPIHRKMTDFAFAVGLGVNSPRAVPPSSPGITEADNASGPTLSRSRRQTSDVKFSSFIAVSGLMGNDPRGGKRRVTQAGSNGRHYVLSAKERARHQWQTAEWIETSRQTDYLCGGVMREESVFNGVIPFPLGTLVKEERSQIGLDAPPTPSLRLPSLRLCASLW